jgi:hypothetical protein
MIRLLWSRRWPASADNIGRWIVSEGRDLRGQFNHRRFQVSLESLELISARICLPIRSHLQPRFGIEGEV